jgi:hypothetical protein
MISSTIRMICRTAYNMDKEGGYYDFLFRRIDLLNSFPVDSLMLPTEPRLQGMWWMSYRKECLVLMLACGTIFLIFRIKVFSPAHSQQIRSCLLRAEIKFRNSGRSYVSYVISDTSVSKKNNPVTVYKYVGGKRFCVSENPDLAHGTQILVHGQKHRT